MSETGATKPHENESKIEWGQRVGILLPSERSLADLGSANAKALVELYRQAEKGEIQ